jgi:hypothetical protein
MKVDNINLTIEITIWNVIYNMYKKRVGKVDITAAYFESVGDFLATRNSLT